jgi:hypothetical protein
MFSALIESATGLGPGLEASMTRSQGRTLLLIYGAGFVAVFLTLALLYRHAWRRRDRLELDAFERFDTRTSLQHYSLSALVGVLSISIAAIGGVGDSFWAGMSYFLLGPVTGFHAALRGRRRRKLELAET